MLSVSSPVPISDPPARPSGLSPDARPRSWAVWAGRLEREPERLTAGDLARAAWETATNTTDRYLAALVAEALGAPVRPDVPPPHISPRRAQVHPHRPTSGWDRVLWVLENHLPGRLCGFSGACCLAALAAGAPTNVWNVLINNGWVEPHQNILCEKQKILCGQPFAHDEKQVAERAWWSTDYRHQCLLQAPESLVRPYAIETICDAVTLWGPLDRLEDLLVREDATSRGVATNYGRAVSLSVDAPAERQARLRAKWLAAVAQEDADLARGPNPSGVAPWWFPRDLNTFLEQGTTLPEMSVVAHRRQVHHTLDMLVHLAADRLGLRPWLEVRNHASIAAATGPSVPASTVVSGLASSDASRGPEPDAADARPHPTRLTLLQDACAQLTLVPTRRAVADPAGFAAALAEANKRALRPPGASQTNRSALMSLPVLNTVWAVVCRSLCAPDDQATAWSAYRFQEVCDLLEGGKEVNKEVKEVRAVSFPESPAIGERPGGRRLSPRNAASQSLLGWGMSLALGAPSVVRVLLGARFGMLIVQHNPALLATWAARVEQDVNALIEAGAPLIPWPPAPPLTGTVLKDHVLLCMTNSAVDVEKMVDPVAAAEPEPAPPEPIRRPRML